MLNGTCKCIYTINECVMILGKEYEFTDGWFIREDGSKSCNCYESIGHYNQSNYSKIARA